MNADAKPHSVESININEICNKIQQTWNDRANLSQSNLNEFMSYMINMKKFFASKILNKNHEFLSD